MASYVPNPTDPTQPTIAQAAGNMAYELQALKGYIQGLVTSGSSFYYNGAFRNRLKNGDFRVVQRGATVSVTANTTAYTVDQWSVSSFNSATQVSQLVNTLSAATKGIQLVPAVNNTSVSMFNRIESLDCLDLVAGTKIVVSGYINVNTVGSNSIPSISLLTPQTTADTFSSLVTVGAGVPAGIVGSQSSGIWQFFFNVFTLSADATRGLQLNFSWPQNMATYLLNFANIQLEVGSTYTGFEKRPIGLELSLCQRYYQGGTLIMAGNQTIGASVQLGNPLSVAMRTTPTFVIGSNTSTNLSSVTVGGSAFTVFNTAVATATGLVVVNIAWTASAEL